MTGNTSINNPKIIRGWALYDWANSVYNLVITSTIFPAYYEAITANKNNNEILFFIWVGLFYFNSYSIKHLLLLAILAAVAFETRLAGITIVITGGLLILLATLTLLMIATRI